jgi:hypothetical protein
MSTNDVFKKYRELEVSLRIDTIDDDDDNSDVTVLIEGNSTGLQMLSELFNALAQDKKECGLQISPRGAGNRYFSSRSKFGLYIHCTDWCHMRKAISPKDEGSVT